MSDEKTEEPTHKKLTDAANKGENPKSEDVSSAALLMTLTMTLASLGPTTLNQISSLFDIVLGQGMQSSDDDLVTHLAYRMLIECLVMVVPYFAVAIAVGAIAGLVQTGIVFTFEPLG